VIGGKGFVGAIFFLIGSFFAIGALWQIAETNWIAINGTKADGSILAIERRFSHSTSRGPCYRPRFTFVDEGGTTRQSAHNLCSFESIYRVGEKITVRYMTDNPQDAVIDGFYGRFAFILIFLFASPFVYFGARLFLTDKREHEEEGW
jgi:hypothetical protein